jgi:hypothetical protein
MLLHIPPSLSCNGNGGFYKKGTSYDVVKKQEVAEIFSKLTKENKKNVSSRLLAREAKVSKNFSHKVDDEIRQRK